MIQPPRHLPAGQTGGIALFCISVLLLCCMDVLIKLSSEGIPVFEILFFRSGVALLVTLAVALARRGRQVLTANRPGLLLLRGVIGVVAASGFFAALSLMPIMDAYAIGFSGPLLITMLSALILAERVGVRRWAAVVVGFIGVLIVLRPGETGLAGFLNAGGAVACIGVLGYSLLMVLTRLAGKTDAAATMVIYSMAVMTAASALTLPFIFVAPTWGELAMLVALGLIGGGAHFLMAMAYQRAEASLLAPFEYTSLLWGLGFGWAIWGDLPDEYVIGGSALIIAAGLYVLHREALRHHRPSHALPGAREAAAEEEAGE
ncbi:MAG: DMT family transporter [Rhodospirillaceae bacterium]|nr:DMT family transporter [Rhodospirillaceae bacterium]